MIGIDLLALARHDIKMLCAEIAPGTAIGCLMGTFGSPLSNLEKLLATGKVPAVRIHLTNGCCTRSNNCEWQYELKPNDLRGMAARATRCQALAAKYPAVKFYLSPRLEHDEKDVKLVQSWIDTIKKYAPSCTPIISYATGATLKGVLIERHGNGTTGDIVSNDGESLSDAAPGYLTAGKLITFAWLHSFNGRGSGDKVFLAPSQRKPDYFGTADDIRYCNTWLKGIEATPTIPGAKLIKAPEILKPYSEYYSTISDPREKKPCFLALPKVPYWSIRTLAGSEIVRAAIFEPPFGQLHRYYSPLNSVQLMQKAGSQWVLFVSGATKYLVNVIFRGGALR